MPKKPPALPCVVCGERGSRVYTRREVNRKDKLTRKDFSLCDKKQCEKAIKEAFE